MLLAEVGDFLVRVEGVDFDLVDGGDDAGFGVEELLQLSHDLATVPTDSRHGLHNPNKMTFRKLISNEGGNQE